MTRCAKNTNSGFFFMAFPVCIEFWWIFPSWWRRTELNAVHDRQF